MLLLSMFLLLEYLERSPAVSWGNLGRFTLIFFILQVSHRFHSVVIS